MDYTNVFLFFLATEWVCNLILVIGAIVPVGSSKIILGF
jgi:hypothetical protein